MIRGKPQYVMDNPGFPTKHCKDDKNRIDSEWFGLSIKFLKIKILNTILFFVVEDKFQCLHT